MQNGTMYKLCWICLILLLGHVAFAAKTQVSSGGLPLWEGKSYQAPMTNDVPLAATVFAAEEKEALKRGKRSLASADNYEQMMSPELKKLRSALLEVRTAEDLHKALISVNESLTKKDSEFQKLKEANKQYSEADRDYYYIAAQIAPLQCLRGFTWRFTPLAEKSKVIESRMASEVMQMAQAMGILSPRVEDLPQPEDQMEAKKKNEANISKAVFDYLTLPYDGAVLFTISWHMQEHLFDQCYGELSRSAKRLERINLTNPIVWDNKMFFGVGTFPDDLDRYKLLGEAERHYSLAMKHEGMHLISFLNSYSLHGFFELQYELNRLFAEDAGLTSIRVLPLEGKDSFLTINGVSLMERRKKIMEPRFHGVFRRYKGSEGFMEASFNHLKRSVQEYKLTWDEIKDRPFEERRVINPAFLTGFRRGIGKTLDTWLKLVEGPTELHSRLTDRKVLVDIRSIYLKPFDDLKELLPTKFDVAGSRFPANEYRTLERDLKKPDVIKAADKRFSRYRNFYYGAAKEWDLSQWQRLFPELANSDYEGFKQNIRTLQQEWGGSLIAAPFMPFMR